MISISFLTFLLAGCCHYPKGRIAKPAAGPSQVPALTIVAYGDTRTGPWGLGDNAKQAIHGKVIDDILEHDGKIDAVIFTGDAVMTNFFLWKKAYWKCFLSQSDRFRAAGIPFFPSLGNHEVLSPFVPVMKISASSEAGVTQRPAGAPQDVERQVARAYELGEEPTAAPPLAGEAAVAAQQIDPNSKQGQALLKQWERGINKGDPASANKFGQFERNLQSNFYDHLQGDERCQADAKTFSDDYLVQAKYEYLRPILDKRSYYSKILENGGVQVKIIALDTNCLDSQEQKKFFADEVKTFEGPIIVFGHHPPVDYEAGDGWSWDKVKGWGEKDTDPLKSYFTARSKIVLWIFGHVHDYQRRDSSGVAPETTPPVLLIAGGGGASLDANYAPFQWQPAGWPKPLHKSQFSQVKIKITNTQILVDTRGTAEKTAPFQIIDSFSIPLSQKVGVQ